MIDKILKTPGDTLLEKILSYCEINNLNPQEIGDNLSVYAIVNEDMTINLPEQTINNQIFKGSGLISDDFTEITWNYTIEDDNGTITSVTGKYTYGVTS